MAFVVVQFLETDEVVIISQSWLVDETVCKWPPYEDKLLIKRALLEKRTPESNWESCSIFIIGVHKTYAGAKKEVYRVLHSDSDGDDKAQERKRQKIESVPNISTSNQPTVVVVKTECLDCTSPAELILVPDKSIPALSASLENNNITGLLNNSNNCDVNHTNSIVPSNISRDIVQTQQISSSSIAIKSGAAEAKDSKLQKKFAVVNFIDEDSVEIIPTSWLINNSEARWPETDTPSVVTKYIQECKPALKDWKTVQIKIFGYSNSFKMAKRKAVLAMDASSVDSVSSEDNNPCGRRKRQMPARFKSFEVYQSDPESEVLSNIRRNTASNSSRDACDLTAVASDNDSDYVPVMQNSNQKQKRRSKENENLSPQVFFAKMNTDMRGVKRGACQNCDCKEYLYIIDQGSKCAYCFCPPTKHAKIGQNLCPAESDKSIDNNIHCGLSSNESSIEISMENDMLELSSSHESLQKQGLTYPCSTPKFSPAVTKHIEDGVIMQHYGPFVRECAAFLLTLAKEPTKSDYNVYCKSLADKYDFLNGQNVAEGCPYACFRRALSRCIRNARYYNKTKEPWRLR